MSQDSSLSLETIAAYLREQAIVFDLVEQQQHFIRMRWTFAMGEAVVLISVNQNGLASTTERIASRLEITCVTEKQYVSRRDEVLLILNQRNRERAFSRSMDHDGNVWIEYIGFYAPSVDFSKALFVAVFESVLMHFQDDYALLERYEPVALSA